MKKLYANGCSFTHGHTVTESYSDECDLRTNYTNNDYTYTSPYRDPVAWPSHLTDRFSEVFNHSLFGTGAQRLTRTTLEFLNSVPDHEIDDWVFVLQFSQPNRVELLLGEKYTHYVEVHMPHEYPYDYRNHIDVNRELRFLNTTNSVDHDDFNDDANKIADSYRTCKDLARYINHARSFKQQLYEQVKELYILINVLESRGCKYIITGMDTRCHDAERLKELYIDRNYADMAEPTYQLLCQVPTHNIVKCTDTILAQNPDYHDPCGHPNRTGHQIFADYLATELTNRGYI